jgi:hypothetical protein
MQPPTRHWIKLRRRQAYLDKFIPGLCIRTIQQNEGKAGLFGNGLNWRHIIHREIAQDAMCYGGRLSSCAPYTVAIP